MLVLDPVVWNTHSDNRTDTLDNNSRTAAAAARMQEFAQEASTMKNLDLLGASNTEETTATSATAAAVSSSTPSYVDSVNETSFEKAMDIVFAVAFVVTAIVAFRRMYTSHRPSSAAAAAASTTMASSSSSTSATATSAETTVVTAFYSLILLTSVLRALWFGIPATVWEPSYTPTAVYAFDPENPSWVGAALSEVVVTAGSLSLFSIFILILVYWADILKKYFHPGSRRSLPMMTFISFVASLGGLILFNLLLFLCRLYTTEGMILFHAVLLAVVSMICVVQITIFSHRFQTVLKTLGAINQVSTDNQVRRIVWITVTGNLFFVTRAALETLFCIMLLVYWHYHGTVDRVFSHTFWDTYTAIKYTSEVTILALMLYILQSRFRNAAASAVAQTNKNGYTRVPDADLQV